MEFGKRTGREVEGSTSHNTAFDKEKKVNKLVRVEEEMKLQRDNLIKVKDNEAIKEIEKKVEENLVKSKNIGTNEVLKERVRENLKKSKDVKESREVKEREIENLREIKEVKGVKEESKGVKTLRITEEGDPTQVLKEEFHFKVRRNSEDS